jgi:uncharacterized membrane-anchored protein
MAQYVREPAGHASARRLASKVPEVTVFFWVIKILCTTVGETAADFLNVNLNLGLTVTSVVMAALLVMSLVLQFSRDRYVPWVYWLAVALISVVGTLVTDNLSDNLGVPLEVSTVVFSVLLAGVFTWWYRSEGTLSIHSIITRRREGFYWLGILCTFALGTAAGDLMAEVLGLGYLISGIIVVSLVALTAVAWRLGLDSVLAFWIIYVLTRPLGASLGDYLSQPAGHGGVGLGATGTSVLFTAGIIALVSYLSISKADTPAQPGALAAPATAEDVPSRRALLQTIVVVLVVLLGAGIGYPVRKAALAEASTAPSAHAAGAGPLAASSSLGDLSPFAAISQDTLDLLSTGRQSAATARVTDLETAWDNAEATLRPKDQAAWKAIDTKIDTVLRAFRSTHPDMATEKTTPNALLATLR